VDGCRGELVGRQWEVPFVLDDTRFRTTFGVTPTPLDEAIAETARWASSTFARAA